MKMRLFSDRARGTGTLGKRGKRGMALLMVVTMVAVLTSVVVEFAYSTHVDLRLAANARDSLRAEYLARSATTFARLVLGFQAELPKELFGGNVQFWQIIPLDSTAINGFVDAVRGESEDDRDVPLPPLTPEPGQLVPAEGLSPFGNYQGAFSVDIEDEEAKINVNKLNNPGMGGNFTALALLQLFSDERWQFLFEEENLHRERVTPEELVIRLRDWIDENEVEQALDLLAPTSYFVDTASDEARNYGRYPQRYRPKNNLFDTMDELHLVSGMSDRLMAAFGDRLTVFPDINAKISLNTNDPLQLLNLLRLMAVDPNHMAFNNPATVESMLNEVMMLKSLNPFGTPTADQFAAVLTMHGLEARRDILESEFGTASETFRIRATGQVGEVSRTLTTVIRLDGRLGKVLYYRED